MNQGRWWKWWKDFLRIKCAVWEKSRNSSKFLAWTTRKKEATIYWDGEHWMKSKFKQEDNKFEFWHGTAWYSNLSKWRCRWAVPYTSLELKGKGQDKRKLRIHYYIEMGFKALRMRIYLIHLGIRWIWGRSLDIKP